MAEEMEATAVELDPAVEERVQALIEGGRPADCVDLSEVDSLVQEMNLSEEEADQVHERIEAPGCSIEDDCGREADEPAGLPERRARRADHRRPAALLQRDAPLPAAHQGGGDRAGPGDRARRPRGQGAADQLEPPAGRLERPPLHAPGPQPAGPDPGGHPRPDPRLREVRLAQGLQVLDLRDLLDPPGDSAGARVQGAHDPGPEPGRPAGAQGDAHRARAGDEPRPRPDAPRRSPRRPSWSPRRSRRSAT